MIYNFHIKILDEDVKVVMAKKDRYLIVSSYTVVNIHNQSNILGYDVILENNVFKWELNNDSFKYGDDRNYQNEINIERFLNASTYDQMKNLFDSKLVIDKFKL